MPSPKKKHTDVNGDGGIGTEFLPAVGAIGTFMQWPPGVGDTG